MSNPNDPGNVEEIRNLLDRLNQIDERWWEAIAREWADYPEDDRRKIREGLEIVLRNMSD